MKLPLQVIKRHVLGAEHDPQRLQLELLLAALQRARMDVDASLAEQTLKNWWDGKVQRPKASTSQYLDLLAAPTVKFLRHADGSWNPPPEGYFRSLQSGGLVRHLWDHAKKAKMEAILSAMMAYQPESPLHLHLDAIEVAALDIGCGIFPWQVLKEIAAEVVLYEVHRRWSISGTAYRDLSSNLRLLGEQPRAGSAPAKNALERHFDRQLNGGAVPAWDRIPVDVDDNPTQALRTMVSLAGDGRFWVADRLDAWALDLASAILATGALLWSDRYTNFHVMPGARLGLWASLTLWFPYPNEASDEAMSAPEPDFDLACDQCGLDPVGESRNALVRARAAYTEQMSTLGLSMERIGLLVSRCQRTHPLRTKG